MKFKNIKIGYKLSLGFGLILILAILIGIIANRNIDKMWQYTQSIHNHPMVVSKAVRDIQINIIAMHRSMKDVVLANNDIQIVNAEAKVDDYERQVFKSFDIVFDQFLGDMNDVQSAYDAFVNWKPIRNEVIQLSYAEKKDEAAAITIGKGANYVNILNRKIQTMIDFADQKGDSLYQEALLVRDNTIRSSLILLLAIVFIGILISTYITYSITKPLSSMLSISKRLIKGDLTARNTIRSSEETGILASSFNELAKSIETRIGIQQGVSDISETMIGRSNMQSFGTSLLKRLMKITNANMSTFYILNESTMEYEHFASVGANKEMLSPFNAESPQGEFGNALSTKKIFHLKDIPEDTIFKFITIAGEAIPKEIITIPIVVENNIIALISLVNIQKFNQESINILNQSWTSINTAYSNLLSNERTSVLAEHLSMINQQLEAQTEELQEQSEELQNQAIELQHTSDELQEQNVELEAQKIQVEAANKLKSEFLSNMSHELRTPLNSIMALSQVLIMQTKNKLDKEEFSYLEIVRRNGKNLLALINNILDLSKIESGKTEIHPKTFSIGQLLEITKENLQSMAKAKGINISLQLPSNTPNIESDKQKLHQVFTNIIGNAVKFTDKGNVNILANYDDENVIVEVSDSGIGISKEMLPHIFDEFRQGDGSTSRRYEGTGLGLAIANKLISILGGNIKAESILGKGTLFTISLPIKWDKNKFPNEDKLELKNTLSQSKEHTILVVDDDPLIVKNISNFLNEEGYDTRHASSGKEALKLAEKYQPFAITLDIIMPNMDGWEVLQKLKINSKTRSIPVIIVSVSNERDTGFALGAMGYIQKPVDKNLLISEIKRVHKAPNTVMIVDDNEFDRNQIAKIVEAEHLKPILAKGGVECLKLLESETPDLLVLNLMMPDLDGFEVLQKLRAKEQTKDLPVIVVTAKDLTPEDKAKLSGKISSMINKSESTQQDLFREIKRVLVELKQTQHPKYLIKEKSAPRILMVEDNPDAIIQVKAVLEKAHYIIDVATSGQEALDYIKHTIPDGIILDLMMPEIDGFEVLENIRNTPKTRQIPVLILTAKDLTKKDLAKLSANHIQQIIHKGDIDIEGLLQKVKMMLKGESEKQEVKIPITLRKNPKVLVVEDNQDNMITIKAILGEKFNIAEAIDGEKGLRMAQTLLPDLVLLDMSLPLITGEEIVKRLKENTKTKNIPIIAVTAQAMKGDRERFIEIGCDGYIPKPIDPVGLLNEISKLLDN